MDDATNLTDPGELLGNIPAMMGFVPGESLIIIHGTSEGVMEGAVRCDLEPLEEVREVAHSVNKRTTQDGMCIVVLVTAAPSKAISCIDVLLEHLTVDVAEIIGCTSLEPGAEWLNPLNPSQRGRVPDWRNGVLTANQVSKGRRIFSSSQDMEKVYAPSEDVIGTKDLSSEETEDLVIRFSQAIFTGDSSAMPSLSEIGSLLRQEYGPRDVLAAISFSQPTLAHSVFTEVAVRTRGKVRVEALTLAGMTAYAGSQGSLAQAAFVAATDTAILMDPPFHSEMLEAASDIYFSGVKPDEFKTAFLKSFSTKETP